MAKKNREKKSKNRLEAAKELMPDLRNCSTGSCASKKSCSTDDRCK